MAKTTYVYFDGFLNDDTTRVFRTTEGFPICVKSCENEIVTLYMPYGVSIRKLSDVILGCFNKNSNFAKQISNFYGCPKVSQINFTFNGIDMSITEKNANNIFENWRSSYKSKLKDKEKCLPKT